MEASSKDRFYELDWIRNVSILALFFYHTAAIFAGLGDFYITSPEPFVPATIFVVALYSWYMPLLFFVAGASTSFSLLKRGPWLYFLERIKKILLPFVVGTLLVVPIQSYLGQRWRGNLGLSYGDHLIRSFTSVSDFLGFDGKFTPGHLWFLIYLFAVSLVGMGIIHILTKPSLKPLIMTLDTIIFSPLGAVLLALTMVALEMIPKAGGKGIVTNLLIFIIGFLCYKSPNNRRTLGENWQSLSIAAAISWAVGALWFFGLRSQTSDTLKTLFDTMATSTILVTTCYSLVAIAMVYLQKPSPLLHYLNKAAFPVYIVHQSVLVILAFFIIPLQLPPLVSIPILVLGTVVLSFGSYELIRRIPGLRLVLGAK